MGFQSTRRVGRDCLLSKGIGREYVFQSTRPRGARTWREASIATVLCEFQSTRRVGRVSPPFSFRLGVGRFQSTRPRGARRVRVKVEHRIECFNPTRPRWG